MTVTLGERGVIDYDQVVTLPIKTSHTHIQQGELEGGRNWL